MAQRITVPNGNSHSPFVLASIKLYEGKGVVCLDARGKPLEWIPVEDVEKARRVRDMLTGALNGERRYRTLDWSFLTEPLPQAPSQAAPTPTSAPSSEPDAVPAAIAKPKASK